MPSVPDACIFCRKPGGSHEHLWSAKLGLEIASHLPADSRRSYKAKDVGTGSDDFKDQGMRSIDTTIPCVCHRCNNEWMNRLDERTNNKLTRLVRGQNAEYTLNETIHLASWLAMKMIVRDEYENTFSVFSPDDKANFYLTGLAPQNMWLGIALCGEPIWTSAFQRQERGTLERQEQSLLPAFRAASYAMGLGATIAFAEFPIASGRVAEIPDDQVLTIWPTPTSFIWPARRRLSGAEVRKIAMRFMPWRESAGDLFGRSQMRMSMPVGNRQQRRSKGKNKP